MRFRNALELNKTDTKDRNVLSQLSYIKNLNDHLIQRSYVVL